MKVSKPVLVSVLSIVALLTLGTGTVLASDNAVPGDFLYPVDMIGETVQKTLTMNRERKAELEIKLSEERLKELNTLDDANSEVIESDTKQLKNIKGLDIAIENFYEQRDRLQNRMDEVKGMYENGEITLERYEKIMERLTKMMEKNQNRINKMDELQNRIENRINQKREKIEENKVIREKVKTYRENTVKKLRERIQNKNTKSVERNTK